MTRNFLFSIILILPLCAMASPSEWDDWQHGMDGYEAATATAESEMQPMLVYFNEDWDGWSRRLNVVYLTTDEFKAFIDPFQRVEIDPEKEDAGRQLFDEYGSTVYPAFYVVLPGSGQAPVRLSPFRGGEEIPVEDFLADIQREINTQYHNWIHTLVEQQDYAQADTLIQVALAFDESYAGTHGLRARLLHVQAEQRLDVEMLEQAREAYREALRLDPSDEYSRYWLNRIGETDAP